MAALAPDPGLPPTVRLTRRPDRPAAGALMRSDRPDPDDVKPNASHVPRTVHGWRSYCPLRRMLGNRGSAITEAHVMAADKLRELVDLATGGYTPARPLLYIAQVPQPRAGLTRAGMAQAAAARAVRRAVAPFTPGQCLMVEAIILGNQTLNAWTASRTYLAHAAVEKGRLLSILDQLAQHFDSEIGEELSRGRRLPP